MNKTSIQNSLIEQLKSKGAEVDHFTDLISDYISFWEIKSKLQKDVRARGVTYTGVSSVGVPMQKNNPSVKELVMVNRQMLSILKELDLNTDNVGSKVNDEL